jgi:hypothetical protein
MTRVLLAAILRFVNIVLPLEHNAENVCVRCNNIAVIRSAQRLCRRLCHPRAVLLLLQELPTEMIFMSSGLLNDAIIPCSLELIALSLYCFDNDVYDRIFETNAIELLRTYPRFS